jgi:hypothetical protein
MVAEKAVAVVIVATTSHAVVLTMLADGRAAFDGARAKFNDVRKCFAVRRKLSLLSPSSTLGVGRHTSYKVQQSSASLRLHRSLRHPFDGR